MLFPMNIDKKVASLAKPIRLVAFDVDGVFTDGKLIYSADGELAKAFHVHDGQGIRLLQQAGIAVAIITARESQLVERRFTELGVTHIFQKQHRKDETLLQLMSQLALDKTQVAYVGDDLPDLRAMQQAGLTITVDNAVQAVKAVAHWQTKHAGGDGAVREVCDMILTAQDQWDTLLTAMTT